MALNAYLINEGFDKPVHKRRLDGAFAHRAPNRFHMVKYTHYVAFYESVTSVLDMEQMDFIA